MLGTRLFWWKYVTRFASSELARVSRACAVLAEIMRVVSSAYVYTVEEGTVWMMSLMYNRKKVVERVLPWGIPWVMVCGCDSACCVWVVWRLL